MKGRVYFVSAPGRVKVGYTKTPENRLAKLRQVDMEELTVIGVVAATRKSEKSLQAKLSKYLIKGEWFRDCHEVRDAITQFMHGAERTLQEEAIQHPLSALDEMSFVAKASRNCKAMIEAERRAGVSTERAISIVAIKTGLGHSRVWSLQYRNPNFVTAAEMAALEIAGSDHPLVAQAQAVVGEE